MLTTRLLEQISRSLPGAVFVVGGAVRDRLRQEQAKDLDLVLADVNSHLLDPATWQEQGSAAFWLDEQRKMVRIPSPDLTIDLAALQGPDLAADLARRDFTVNAIACALEDWLACDSAALIDPFHGQADLCQKRLRLVHPAGFADDPVRILRAARLGQRFGLAPDQETLSAMSAAAPSLLNSPAERIWAELGALLCHEQAKQAISQLELVGAVAVLFPEVAAMSGVSQNEHHQFTVDVHSARAFAAYLDVIHHGRYLPQTVQAAARAYWQELGPDRQAAVMLAAWLHDIGKPRTRVIRDGRVTFYEHEHVGAKLATAVAKRLKLSQAQTQLIHTFITFHMYPLQLWRTGRLDDRLIHRLYRRTGELGVAIVLFTLADHLAKGEQVSASAEFSEHQQLVERLLMAYFCRHEQVISPKPWLSGDEIMQELGKPPGPLVGELKAALLEAQAGGQVTDRQLALQFVRQYQAKQSGKQREKRKQRGK